MIAEIFYRIGDMLDYINNYIQFILLVFTILSIFFFFMLPYIRPLKLLLGGIGFSRRHIVRALWICYKNPRKHIRIFIELAIVKSKGQHQSKEWWSNFIRVFKRFLDDNEAQNDYTAEVDSPFDLVATEFNDLVKAYFDYFKQNKASDKFAIPVNEPVSFIINLEINEGYIVPITFITGLNDRYDEDWVKILSNYFTAFGEDASPETAILPQELYFTYNWLMWGPSYQIKYDREKDKLIQFGFGDESNSVNVIVKNDAKGQELWDILSHDAEVNTDKKFGYNCSFKGKLFDTSEYYNYNYERIDNKAIPFLKRLTSDYLGIPYLFELIDFNVKTNLKAENYFFSAYLWIMFGLKDDYSPGFTPRKSLTFFEHANLADIHNYVFLAETLIDKCFKHFDSIAAHPEHSKRKYYYCLSMNTYIEKLFKERIEKAYNGTYGTWYKNNLATNTPYTIGEILDTFDNYFVAHEEDYNLIEVDFNKKDTIKHLCNFFAETHYSEFKSSAYNMSLDTMFAILQQEHNDYKFYISLAIGKENVVLGGAVCAYIPAYNCGFIDSIAVNQNHRNYGVGKRLLNHSIQLMRQDALVETKNALDLIFAPIPDFCFDNKVNKKYRFWNNNGFKPTSLVEFDKKIVWTVLSLREDSERFANIQNVEEIIAFIKKIKKTSFVS